MKRSTIFVDTAEEQPETLGRRSAHGGFFTAINQVSLIIINTLGMMVLARILTPAEFGLVAKVSALTGLAMLCRDFGMSLATVQSKTMNHEQLSAIFWINMMVTLAVSASVIAAAPAIAWFYDDSKVIPIAMIVAATIFLGGLSTQHRAVLQRQMNFKAIAATQIIATLIGVLSAILLAPKIRYFAIPTQQLAAATVTLITLWILLGWLPALKFRGTGIRSHLKMGTGLTLWNLLNYAVRNVDNILIGKFWGENALGVYEKAYSIILLPLKQVSGPLSSVAVPTLSRLIDQPNRYKDFFLKGTFVAMLLQVPLSFIAFISGEEIVLVLLGDQWIDSVPIFIAMSPALLSAATSPATNWIYLSRGDSSRMLKALMVTSPIYLIAFLTGLPWGPLGVAYAFSTTSILVRVPNIIYSLKGTSISAIEFFRQMLLPLGASLIASFGAWTIGQSIDLGGAITTLGVKIAVFASIYLCLVATSYNAREVGRLLFRTLSSRSDTEAPKSES